MSMKMDMQKISGLIISSIGIIANVVFLNVQQINKSFHSIILINICVICAVFQIVSSIVRKNQTIKFSFLWRLSLCVLFPITTSILILENQQQIWLYSYFLALIFFLFDLDLKHTDAYIILSLFVAYFLENHTSDTVALELQTKCFYGSVLFFILFNSYYLSKFSRSSQEQIQKLRLLGGAIAHELRTPLSAIASGVQGLKGAMPVLVESYQLRCAEKKELGRYEPYQLNALLETPDSIFQTATESSMMIDMLLMKIKTDSAPIDYSTPISAASICQKTLSEYPFRLGEKEKITLHTNNDFVFLTHEKSFKNVILNLLKNALYQIAKHSKGEIEIWLTGNNRHNTIHFKDTASGIKETDLINLFTESHRISENGTGIGLPFCKLIVENSGGNIECRSVFGEYTEFILQFPTITLTKETQ